MNISICIATYNGSKYIIEQINSIIPELHSGDEIIVVDDSSTDNTVQIVKELGLGFLRIYTNETNCGHVYTFERAISLATNELIVLSDQDDIWVTGRIEFAKSLIKKSNKSIACTQFSSFGTDSLTKDRYLRLDPAQDNQITQNILNIAIGRMPYYGATMFFRASAREYLLPFPSYIEAHDLWIATCGNIFCDITHSPAVTLRRRIHEKNLTPKTRRAYSEIIKSRIVLIGMIFESFRRRIFK